MEKIALFWNRFLKATNRDISCKYSCHFHFELTEKLAHELLRLVLIGHKKATSSSMLGYEITKEPLPQVGELSIVTDFHGNPRCVIETTNIQIYKFKDITFDICKREGEDDSLESWQKNHMQFFTAEGKEMGYQFNEDMLVCFEDFEMIYFE